MQITAVVNIRVPIIVEVAPRGIAASQPGNFLTGLVREPRHGKRRNAEGKDEYPE